MTGERTERLRIVTDGVVMEALLAVPASPRGIVVIASAGGSPSRAGQGRALRARGLATLLIDLLVGPEHGDPRHRLDVFLLARRLAAATAVAGRSVGIADLPIGYLGIGSAAAGALLASIDDRRVAAVVCRGRPDLAEGILAQVTAPTLLLADRAIVEPNARALDRLRCPKELVVSAGSSRRVPTWLGRHLGAHPATAPTRRRHGVAAPVVRAVGRSIVSAS